MAMWSGATTCMKSRCGYGVSEDRPRPTGRLTISSSGLRKIARRGYVLDDAQAVFERDPLWKWQPASVHVDDEGRLFRLPARWRMVGRGPRGLILCVIIDLPGVTGESEVVTMFDASPRHQSEYDDWVRRRL